MRPTDLKKLFKAMRTEAPSRLDLRVYDTIDHATPRTVHSLSLWRKIMRSPITKLAVAAVFIVGCLFLVRHLKGGDSAPEPQPTIVKNVKPERPLPSELALAQTLYEQRDIPGLLTLLEIGQLTTRMTVAEFLAEIGDESAIPVLQRLADVWQGEGESPFQHAIDRITQRTEKHRDAEPMEKASEQAEEQQGAATEVGPSAGIVKTGVVDGLECTGILKGQIENAHQEPIDHNYYLKRITILPMSLSQTSVSVREQFKLPWSRDWYAEDCPLQLMVIDGHFNEAVIVSVEDPDEPISVALLPAHRITGQVIDAEGLPMPDTWIKISLVSEFECSLPVNLVRTDTEGRFTSHFLPTEQVYEVQLTYPERLDYDLHFEYLAGPINQVKIERQSDSLIDLGYIPCLQKESDTTVIRQETPDLVKSFYELYALNPGENLKFVKPPYMLERQDFLVYNLPPKDLNRQTVRRHFVWEWNGSELIYMDLPFSGGPKGWPLRSIFQYVLKIQSYDSEQLDGLRLFRPVGEWVVRQGISEQEKLRALEDILREEGFAIHFEKQRTGEGINDQGEPSYVWVPLYEAQ